MILDCNCNHKYQDSKYGNGKRVFNQMGGVGSTKSPERKYRCTVCGNIRTLGNDKK